MTPVLPFSGDSVGKKGPGRPTVLDRVKGSISATRARRGRFWATPLGLLLDRRSNSVFLVVQLLAQLDEINCNANL